MDNQLYIKDKQLLLSKINLINKRSELKYLINFRKINQTRFYNIINYYKKAFLSKMDNICLNIGEPSSKAKYNI